MDWLGKSEPETIDVPMKYHINIMKYGGFYLVKFPLNQSVRSSGAHHGNVGGEPRKTSQNTPPIFFGYYDIVLIFLTLTKLWRVFSSYSEIHMWFVTVQAPTYDGLL